MRYITSLIFVCYVLFVSAQGTKLSGYSNKAIYENYLEFIKYFENASLNKGDELVEYIPFSLYQCLIGLYCATGNEYNEGASNVKPLQILNNDYYTTVLYEIDKTVDGKNNDIHLATFSQQGIIMKSLKVGTNNESSLIKELCDVNYYDDKILEVIQKLIVMRNEKSLVRQNECTYYVFDKKGFNRFYPEYTLGRQFPMSSTKVLKANDLNIYSTNQLEIMKNEIYAEHGYIFYADHWKEYFQKFNWYKPENNDIDSLLTDIERINIMNIEERLNQNNK